MAVPDKMRQELKRDEDESHLAEEEGTNGPNAQIQRLQDDGTGDKQEKNMVKGMQDQQKKDKGVSKKKKKKKKKDKKDKKDKKKKKKSPSPPSKTPPIKQRLRNSPKKTANAQFITGTDSNDDLSPIKTDEDGWKPSGSPDSVYTPLPIDHHQYKKDVIEDNRELIDDNRDTSFGGITSASSESSGSDCQLVDRHNISAGPPAATSSLS